MDQLTTDALTCASLVRVALKGHSLEQIVYLLWLHEAQLVTPIETARRLWPDFTPTSPASDYQPLTIQLACQRIASLSYAIQSSHRSLMGLVTIDVRV